MGVEAKRLIGDGCKGNITSQEAFDVGFRVVCRFEDASYLSDIYAVSNAVVSLSQQPESFGRTVLEPLAEGSYLQH